MNKPKKIILAVLLILLMLIFFSIVVVYQGVVNLPFYFMPPSRYILIGHYMPMILFWASVVLIALCLIALLVVIFYPKEMNVLKIQEDEGSLTVDKKAIKGFVNSIIEKKAFMEPPKIKVSMTKNKIKVKIRGDLKRTSDLYGQNELLIEEIRNELKQLIGVKQNVTIDVKYQGYSEEKNNAETARVV